MFFTWALLQEGRPQRDKAANGIRWEDPVPLVLGVSFPLSPILISIGSRPARKIKNSFRKD